MGVNATLPIFPRDKKVLKMNKKNISELPYFFTEDSQIQTIEAMKNFINKFPVKLKNIETINLSYNDLDVPFTQNPNLDVSYPLLRILKLTDCNIKNIPPFLYTILSLKELYLDRNYLTNIKIPYENLEVLDLFINNLTALPELPQSLLKLNAGFNNLRTLEFSLQNLTELRLAGNVITHVSPDISFPNATFIDLSHNHIYELPPIAKLAPKIERLQLTFNFLVEAPKDLPDTLIKYDISYNMIEKIDTPLDHLVNLTHLDVEHNLLTELPPLPPNIKNLFTNYNKFKSIAPIQNKDLKLISFLESELTSIPDISKTKAKTLVLTSNQIKEMNHIDYIPPNINKIELISNQITTINPDFLMFKKLITLNLTNNKITAIPKEIISSTINCLMIGQNPIDDLPPLPVSLKTICCSSCKFKKIPNTVLSLPDLDHVDFSCNYLTSAPKIKSKFVNLNCNHISKFESIAPETTVYLIACNKLKTFEIKAENKSLMYLDISYNEISNFKYVPCATLKVLKMNNNQCKGELFLSHFPKVERLDVSETKMSVQQKNDHKFVELVQNFDKSACDHSNDASLKWFQTDSNTGYYEFIGTRPSMEDSLIIRNLSTGAKLLGVLDGHAGFKTATLGAFYIPKMYTKLGQSACLESIQQILRDLNKKIEEFKITDGATAVITLIQNGVISIAHLGDTRAIVVSDDGTASELTADHKATDRMEYDLLKEKRCYLAFGRVNGHLAVSRTIGDIELEEIIRTPAVTSYNIQKTDKYLVLACDGIFDVLSTQEAGEIIHSEKDPARAATKLVSIAYARGSQDNLSVLVYKLNNKEPTTNKFMTFPSFF